MSQKPNFLGMSASFFACLFGGPGMSRSRYVRWREREKGLAVGWLAVTRRTFMVLPLGAGFAQICFDHIQGKNRQTMANPAFG